MKVNLAIENNGIDGFYNLSQMADGSKPNITQCDLQNLDSYIDHNEVDEELLAVNVIDYYPLSVRQQVINHWLCKLSHGAVATIGGLDINEVSRLVTLGNIADIGQINRILYGDITNVWSIRKSVLRMDDMCKIMQNGGQCDIVQVKYSPDGLFYFVTAKRK